MTKKKMTKKELNNRLHALLKEVDALSRECGQDIEVWSHTPDNTDSDYFLGVMVGKYDGETENRIYVYPDDTTCTFKDKPQFLFSTFDYFKACKYMTDLYGWARSLREEMKDA